MRGEAERLGWEGHAVDSVAWQRVVSSGSPKYKRWRLEELLGIMAEEAVAGLPPWHINVADVSRIGRLSGTPGRDKLLRALRTEGYLAARCHISPRGLYTNASMSEVVEVAKRRLRLSQPPKPSNDARSSLWLTIATWFRCTTERVLRVGENISIK
uniref:Uncharacterized protein n=1 Tax=Tetraselmis chuii TaxID=63592 RepID=A0A6U1HQ93_9CHLO|mmetsp:Transcript_28838/g.51579  ORF Transcript_28838/g.51579 Transcript_28838/m.51579 type:complete len:156 (+) Transcript_28838:417-884(+)